MFISRSDTEADTRTAWFDNVCIYIASVYKEVGVLLANMTRFTKGTTSVKTSQKSQLLYTQPYIFNGSLISYISV